MAALPAERSPSETVVEDPRKKCPDCGSTEIEHDSGEYYCRKCGYVIDV